MIITFDPAKDGANIAKHGISLARAVDLLWDDAMLREDNRLDYGERRMIAFAPMNGRLHVAVFTDRLSHRRVISLRKANKRELSDYVKFIRQMEKS